MLFRSPNLSGDGERNVKMEDGILLPKYQLPTEAEWEYAALALIGNSKDSPERIWSGRIYPWNGHYLRKDTKKDLGKFMANFQRGRGDMMGVAGALNDNGSITVPVDSYWPNDFGLYCMAGNVNEWVMDVYRNLTTQDANEFRPFRGNVYKTQIRDEEGAIAEKDTLGQIQWRDVSDEEAFNRYNYNTADNINYLDGDFESSLEFRSETADKNNTNSDRVYDVGKKGTEGTWQKKYRGRMNAQTMIDNRARVYKGGGWHDRAYWMSPGTRRFLDQEQSRDDIGFRCAMFRVGSQVSGM